MMNEALLVITTLMLAAFFAAMEIAFFASNKLRLQLDRKQGLFSSHIIGIFQARSGQYIATIQLGSNFAVVIYGIIMARWIEPVLGQISAFRIQHTGCSNPYYNADRSYCCGISSESPGENQSKPGPSVHVSSPVPCFYYFLPDILVYSPSFQPDTEKHFAIGNRQPV